MAAEELKAEIESGVEFYGWGENDVLVAVMGIQPVKDVTLIRHAYVLTNHQRRGIGEKLLVHLLSLALTPKVLVSTHGKSHGGLFASTKNAVSNSHQQKRRISFFANTGT
jgi:hypothetical protein